MPVERTPMKNRPSNRGSRERRARSRACRERSMAGTIEECGRSDWSFSDMVLRGGRNAPPGGQRRAAVAGRMTTLHPCQGTRVMSSALPSPTGL